MDWLIWAGSAITVIGVGLLLVCIRRVHAARKAGLAEEALKARLQRVLALNLAAVFVSAIGLMLVVLGIILG
ncbi:MAG: hypothetical protein WBA91_08640 [Paracoccaceae bacterium]